MDGMNEAASRPRRAVNSTLGAGQGSERQAQADVKAGGVAIDVVGAGDAGVGHVTGQRCGRTDGARAGQAVVAQGLGEADKGGACVGGAGPGASGP